MIDIAKIQQAILLTQQGKIQEAKYIYENMLKTNPNDANLLSVFGLFYVNIGEYSKACEILTKAAEKNPSFGTLSALGVAELECGNFEESAKYLEESIEL